MVGCKIKKIPLNKFQGALGFKMEDRHLRDLLHHGSILGRVPKAVCFLEAHYATAGLEGHWLPSRFTSEAW